MLSGLLWRMGVCHTATFPRVTPQLGTQESLSAWSMCQGELAGP